MREFIDRAVSSDNILERILDAGLQAPSHDHQRHWEFVVLQEQKDKDKALRFVEEWAKVQGENKETSVSASPAQKMYAYAMPRHHQARQGAL